MNRVTGVLKFVFANFGPLVVFYATNHFYGLMTALVVSVIFSIGEICWKMYRREKLTMMFKYSATITLIFGGVDLFLQQSVLFKYEAALTNIFTGLFFASTLRGDTSLIEEFARKQVGDKPFTIDHHWYFRFLTGLWAFYFFVKAAVYCWLASRYSLEKAMLIRAVVGNVSQYALMGFSMFGARPVFMLLRKFKLLPSMRVAANASAPVLS